MTGKAEARYCPVCGMSVQADENALVYQQMHFAFCSLQCRDRFIQNPHLYIGSPGHKAPVQEGRKSIKQRSIKLDEPLSTEMADQVHDAVQGMMGVEQAHIDGDCITIRYDLFQVKEEQIEEVMANVGAEMGHGWSERLRRAFVHFSEETELDSLAEPGRHCH